MEVVLNLFFKNNSANHKSSKNDWVNDMVLCLFRFFCVKKHKTNEQTKQKHSDTESGLVVMGEGLGEGGMCEGRQLYGGGW